MSGKRVDKLVYRKIHKLQNDIDLGNRMQKRSFFMALAGSIVVLALSYYPSILQKIGIDFSNYAEGNFSGLLGIATFFVIYGILTTRKGKKERKIERKESKFSIIEPLFALSFSLLSLGLLNKSLEESPYITDLSRCIASKWNGIAYISAGLLLFGVLLIFLKQPIQEWIIKRVLFKSTITAFKFLSWSIILVTIGQGLVTIIHEYWSISIGLLCILIGVITFILGFLYIIISSIVQLKTNSKEFFSFR